MKTGLIQDTLGIEKYTVNKLAWLKLNCFQSNPKTFNSLQKQSPESVL